MSDTRSPRFPQWVSYLVFSTITLGSIVEVVKDPDHETMYQGAQNWAVASSAIIFSLCLVVVLLHLNSISSTFVVGTKAEGWILATLVLFWIITVSVVTDSRRGLAVDEFGAVENGNLFYFSWAGFICSITLLVSYLRHVFNVDVAGELRSRSARLTLWSALLATSLVVMGSSANFYDTMCGGEDETGKCSRAVFGIILGALSTLSATGVVSFKIATSKTPFLVEVGISIAVLILYGFGVAFITSQKGPGAPLGNLYYFTWISFLVSFLLVANCFEDYNSAASNNELESRGEVNCPSTNGVSHHIIHEDLGDN